MTAGPSRQLRVDPVMGTMVSIDVRPPGVPDVVLDEAVAWFHDVDRRFSLFRADSEMSRVSDGSLPLASASRDVQAIVALADTLRDRTDGFFDARGHRDDGRLDPTGVVKGWSVDEVLATLRLAGARNLQVGAGGDLIAAGEPEPGRPWRIGIRHPDRADRLAAVLAVRDLAVATSARYERGDHIRVPLTRRPASGLRSVTVVGPTLAMADAFATAAFAMGRAGIAWVARQDGYGALGVTDDDQVVWTELVDGLMIRTNAVGETPTLTTLSGADG